MPSFSSFKELEKALKAKIAESLDDEVAFVAENTLKEHVITDVYDKYKPTQYKRTGGLLQDKNIEVKMIDDNTLSIRSIREEDGKDIAAIIETGVGYTWTDSNIYQMQPFPRPFQELAEEELKQSGSAKKALMDGLKKRGLNVEQ